MPDRKSVVSCTKVEFHMTYAVESDINSLRVLKSVPIPSRPLLAPAVGGSLPTCSICCRLRDPSPKIKHCHFGESHPGRCICCLFKCMHICSWNPQGLELCWLKCQSPLSSQVPCAACVCKAQLSTQGVLLVSDCGPQKCSKYSSYCSNSLKIGQILPLHDTAN